MLLRIIEALMVIGLILMLVVIAIYYQEPAGRVYIILLVLDEGLLAFTHAIVEKYGEP